MSNASIEFGALPSALHPSRSSLALNFQSSVSCEKSSNFLVQLPWYFWSGVLAKVLGRP
jgi:hypothetical protein